MIEHDTVKLLRECDLGIKMGVSSIGDVINQTTSRRMKSALANCKAEHERLEEEIKQMLERYGYAGKGPSGVARMMSKIKTNMMLAVNGSDNTIADLMTDGCNMGIKSLSKYLNKYEAAEERAKDIAKKLIAIEEKLAVQMRDFL